MTTCPQCGAAVPAEPGFPNWCECGWNLHPPPVPEAPRGRSGRLMERLGRRSGERMACELLAAGTLEPRWTAAKLAAYAIAIGVHLLSAALVVGGVAAIVLEFPNAVSILIGLAMAGAGILIRPRTGRFPEDARPVDAPALRELVGAVARELGRPPPDVVAVDASWNAGWTEIGLRRRRVLILGVPLLAALEPPGRVALIAHELGHDRNGDARRSLIIGTAVAGLDRLSALLTPQAVEDERWSELDLGPVDWITHGLMWLVTRPLDALLWVEARLLLRDSQRAEYLADALAARVAGTDAVIALHEQLLLTSTVELAVQQAAHAGERTVLDGIRSALQAVPDRELERRRRVARLEHARLDDTHPPTALRIELLEGRPHQAPAVTLNRAWSERIDIELAPREVDVSRELLDAYRSSLYM